jgi:hypothetical protein
VTTLYLAFANPVDGREAEFLDWYEHTHVPDLLATPGFVSARRFALDPGSATVFPPPLQRYLVIYELDGDFEAAMGNIAARVESGAITLTDSMDMASVAMSFWQPLGPTVTA